MENASKALIIAGSILISILVVSLGVLVFNNFSKTAKEAANMDEQEINEFNSKLIPYTGSSVSGSQVNALIQLVASIDTACISDNDYAKVVTLKYGGTTLVTVEDNNLKRDDTIRRVPTGASEYYKVEYNYNQYGLINEIIVTHN